MSGELHPMTESVINRHMLIRERICNDPDICPGGRYCRDMVCLESFFKVAGRAEIRMEELHNDKR